MPLTTLWANLHGGFAILFPILGLLVLGSAAEAFLYPGERTRRWSDARRYTALGLGAAVASLVNPYGIKLHLHILEIMNAKWLMNGVVEFASPSFRSEQMYVFMALLFLSLAVVVPLIHRRKLTEALWIGFFAYCALISVRHVPLFALVVVPIVAAEISTWWDGWVLVKSRTSVPRILDDLSAQMRRNFVGVSLWVPIFLVAVALGGWVHWPKDIYPHGCPAEMMARHASQIENGRLYTTDQWGDYLIYHYSPRVRVFIDGRSDFYGEHVVSDYLKISRGQYGWRRLLDKHRFDLVLCPVDWALASLIKYQPDWRVIEDDGKVILFQRKIEAAGSAMSTATKPRDAADHGSSRKAAVGSGSAWFLSVLLAFLSVYVLAELTPSSYALALQAFGATPHSVSLGEPRGIRSDEWAVWTPFMQATVRNHFQRYNETSPYHEDLRSVNALPILDWGLIFKPYFWPFFIVPPSYAYSFFFAFQIFCFLYGYRQLLRRAQVNDELAAGGAMLLFFCGCTQYWWTTLGPSLSLFPWVVLAALQRQRWWEIPARRLCRGHMGVRRRASPPAIISLCFVAVILICAFRDRTVGGIRGPLLMTGAVACAAVLIAIYYHDLLGVTMHTVYPGHRRSSSGTESVPLLMGMFAPSFNQNGYQPLGSLNICESSVVGSFLPLCVIAFIDYHAMRRLILGQMQSYSQWRAAILGVSLLFMLAWIFLPVPAPIGEIFLSAICSRQKDVIRGWCSVDDLLPVVVERLWGGPYDPSHVRIFRGSTCRDIPVEAIVVPCMEEHAPCRVPDFPRAAGWSIPRLAARTESTPGRVYACVVANVALFGFSTPFCRRGKSSKTAIPQRLDA